MIVLNSTELLTIHGRGISREGFPERVILILVLKDQLILTRQRDRRYLGS